MAVPLRDEGVEEWVGAEAVAQEVLRGGIHLIQLALKPGEFTNHFDDQGGVRCGGLAYYKHR